jgi:hypothetical protein
MLARLSNARTFSLTSLVLAVIALCGGLAHTVGWLPIEPLEREPRVYIAAVIELITGVLLLGAALSLRSLRPSAWRSALGAHFGALLCLGLGSAVFAGATRVSLWSVGLHGLLFVLIALNAAGLWQLRPRNPLKRAQHEMAARLY